MVSAHLGVPLVNIVLAYFDSLLALNIQRVSAPQLHLSLTIPACPLSCGLQCNLSADAEHQQPTHLVFLPQPEKLLALELPTQILYRSKHSVWIMPIKRLITAALRPPRRALKLFDNFLSSGAFKISGLSLVTCRITNR